MQIWVRWRNVRQEENKAYLLEPKGEPLWIGRQETCPICLHDPSVSRKQATLSLHDKDVLLFVASEHNPVFLLRGSEHHPLSHQQRVTLEEGSQLLLGETYLSVSFVDPLRSAPCNKVASSVGSSSSERLIRCQDCGTEQEYHLEGFCEVCGEALTSGVTVLRPRVGRKS